MEKYLQENIDEQSEILVNVDTNIAEISFNLNQLIVLLKMHEIYYLTLRSFILVIHSNFSYYMRYVFLLQHCFSS